MVDIAANALLDHKLFYKMYQQQVDPNFTEDGGDKDEFVIRTINAASTIFEKFCNRRLKARSYSYATDQGFETDLDYTIFDPPKSNRFWFPTFPVISITTFLIRDVTVTASTDYLATDGYILYKNKGLLVYDQGFDYGYHRCVKIKWRGGYEDDTPEMFELQHLLFQAIKIIINSPENPLLQSETIGSYQYQNYSGFVLNSLKAFSPEIFVNLGRFRVEAIG